ncbi:membrane protein implicated in regulation of membrane protease activity [Streptosporangium becharense]|uniref:Membrane protein implicated in regulation of membrane protease activity n=1 Tax=Streptosporangium becharense TaxID=1816182 RepID=A0A7W9IHX0_9ACTN|nr:NfeD family protein [Streptosporangium becharense]MBB2914708.1 membrane protein implicated in regulation of membrane protease activity [Streptosporangium becharense]MBB5820891.1 membrane protein implicated in regulation of membrane protease activity [Streptosporangium becharense]
MDDWVIWLIVAVTLGVAEIFTLTTVLGLFGGAALFAALAAVIGLPVPLQMIVFTGALVAGLLVVRPVAKRHLRQPPPDRRFGIQALVGKSAYVLREVTGRDGRVRIGGEEWSARAYDETLVIPAGAVVDVIEIEGATALVYPRE